METRGYNVYVADCPSRQVLDLVSDKWTVLIVSLLVKRPYRFGELRRAIGGISQKMLTQTLRNLERDGLVGRRVFPSVPVTVEYSLTPLGETLSAPLAVICTWAEDHMDSVHAARASDQAPPPAPRPESAGGQPQ
ncbi:MAG: helix-turn-helix transcriptional regulator [Chloroflexota bacterium]|nr:helix-turn-helix transcriptional regulator [Chloroflexota bacterium]